MTKNIKDTVIDNKGQRVVTETPLLFIDSNILLDFYRQRRGDVSLKYLNELEKHYKSLIITNQVEMEYKKNRQTLILESLRQFKKDSSVVAPPPILSESQPAKTAKKCIEDYNKQTKELEKKIKSLLKSPSYTDPVFKSLNRIFKNKWDYRQDRDDENRLTLRELAVKRFYLGYPPRKNNDITIGDSINWEYIIDCAKRSGKKIIIVSRDSDYGKTIDNVSYLNDWLHKEFKERVSSNGTIDLTPSLSYALKQLDSTVTTEMVTAENEFINSLTEFQNSTSKMQTAFLNRLNQFAHEYDKTMVSFFNNMSTNENIDAK